MGLSKSKKSKSKSLTSRAKSALSAVKGTSRGGGKRRRSKGPTYWANKVLVERLKKKYNRLKFGGR